MANNNTIKHISDQDITEFNYTLLHDILNNIY